MKIGFIGLGKMGANMVKRLIRGGHEVVGYNRSPEIVNELAATEKMIPAKNVDEVIRQLAAPRVVWMMIPAGIPTEDMLQSLLGKLSAGDIIVDGGNSNFKDSMRRGELAKTSGIGYVDAGVSGGIWGLKGGYSIMAGGDTQIVEHITPLIKTFELYLEK